MIDSYQQTSPGETGTTGKDREIMEKLSDLIGKDAKVAVSTETPKYSGVVWFYLNGKVQHRRLYEEYFSNWPLQYIVVNGAKRLLDTSGLDLEWGLSTTDCLSHIA